ncbi:MAG: hypothetical protein HOO99_05895 [Hyphomicrobiaceae bacterium]|nr:hypothetical protein [Hyphomicrobiaceae bacterium]
MSRRFKAIVQIGFSASVLALVAGFSSAVAADLPYEERYGSAYEDPRYADMYGREPARPKTYTYRYDAPPPPPPVDYGFRAPVPRERVYRDDSYKDYSYKDYGRRDDGYGERHAQKPGCTPKDVVQRELERDGWRGFHDAHALDRNTGTVKARRPSGRLFELRIERCTGDVLAARPLEPLGYGPYADRGVRGYRY